MRRGNRRSEACAGTRGDAFRLEAPPPTHTHIIVNPWENCKLTNGVTWFIFVNAEICPGEKKTQSDVCGTLQEQERKIPHEYWLVILKCCRFNLDH